MFIRNLNYGDLLFLVAWLPWESTMSHFMAMGIQGRIPFALAYPCSRSPFCKIYFLFLDAVKKLIPTATSDDVHKEIAACLQFAPFSKGD